MRWIICSTGTSIARGVPPLGGQADPAAFRQGIRDRIAMDRTRLGSCQALFREISAESNSLQALKAGDGDRIILLHTDTADGLICAEELARLLEEDASWDVKPVAVKGLQVHDAQRFRTEGIQSLFAKLDELCAPLQYSQDEKVVLNATGGYKSIVPYLTLYGLLNQHPVVYLFEGSSALLTLPPVPIHFDYERLSQAMEALRLLQQQLSMPEEDFFKAIPGLEYHDRPWYASLLETDGQGYATLSAFGMMILNALAQQQGQVWLSPQAAKAYAESKGPVHAQFTFMLERVKDPLWRQGKRHSFAGTDLTVFKPGNTSERMACVLQGANIYVCELFRHEEYVRALPGKMVAQYDLKQFKPWSRPPEEPVPAATEEQAMAQLREQLEEANMFLADAQAEHQAERKLRRALEEEVARCSAELTQASHLRDSAQQQFQEAQKRHVMLEAELASARQQLNNARRPWWKKLFGGR